MQVIYGIDRWKHAFKNTALAIGVFDGLHLGHQHLIRTMIRRARSLKGTAVVMTFFPHPIRVLRPDIDLPLLISLRHRLRLIEKLGADVCLVVRFSKSFARLSPERFIEKYLVNKINPREVFVGHDFRFGQNRSGSLEYFQNAGMQHGFRVNVVNAVKRKGEVLSSSLVRKYIREGVLDKAGQLLGHPVSVLGKVVRGDGRGKKLGYPTANIELASDALPPSGVYLVHAFLGSRRYRGLVNVGCRPSFFPKKKHIHVEVHILDFKRNIYGAEILIEFIKRVRDEKAFPSQDALVAQIRKDEAVARRFFARVKQ